MRKLNIFWKFVICNVVFHLLLVCYFYGAFPIGDENATRERLTLHFAIIASGLFLQLIAAGLVLIIKRWRQKVCDKGWKLGLVIAHFVLMFVGVVLISLLAYFIATFTFHISPMIWGPRC